MRLTPLVHTAHRAREVVEQTLAKALHRTEDVYLGPASVPRSKMRVTIWNEFLHEKQDEPVKAIYPDGMHEVLRGALREAGYRKIGTATFDQPQHGLTDDVLKKTDVLVWWSHMDHAGVDDRVVEKIVERVHEGMGIIVLHSGHESKVFQRLMGTSCSLLWNHDAGIIETVHVSDRRHPITRGLPKDFSLPEEMYRAPDFPKPDRVFLNSTYNDGSTFPSGLEFHRGGTVIYLRPGEQKYPTYKNPHMQRLIANAVEYAYPRKDIRAESVKVPFPQPQSQLPAIDDPRISWRKAR
jgi:trehalose utilization protein